MFTVRSFTSFCVIPLDEKSRCFGFRPVGADTWNSKWNVFNLTTVGDGSELDDGVKGNVNPGQILFSFFEKIAEQASETTVSLNQGRFCK